MLYQGQHNRLSHGDTALYITTAINRIRSRFRSRIRSRIRSSVDVAGAAAVAALAAVALALAAVAAVAAVAASAAGTTKQPIYLFLTLILVRCCVIDFNCTCVSCIITHCVAMCGIPYTVRPLLAKVVYTPEIVLRPRRSLPCSVYIVEYTVA
jgi:hypothetical protein